MSFTKQVTFSEPVQQVLNDAVSLPKLEMEDSLTFTRIETPVDQKKKPDSGSKPINKQKLKKRQTVTKSQKLERRNARLSNEIIVTRKNIDEDGKRKEIKNYAPYQNRQRPGRTTSEPLQSKIIIIQRQLEGKESDKKQKRKTALKTKGKKNLITASKQHKRILDLTDKMAEIRLKEAELRSEISSEISTVSSSFSSRASTTRPNTSEDWERVSSAVGVCSGLHGKEESVEEELRLISGLGAYIPRLEDKITNVDKLAHNYAMTRELRNTIHQHMISRSYSYSYFNAIPPYKKKKEKPRKAKLFFNRKVYEDKITVLDFSKKLKSKPPVKAF